MRSHGGKELNAWKQLLLVVAGVVTVATPVIVGVLNPPPLSAQSRPAAVAPLAFEVASVTSVAGSRDSRP